MSIVYRYLIVLIGIISLAAMQPAMADDPLPAPVGRVVWIKGSFKAVAPNKEERILQKASVVYQGDTLITNQSSQAQIVFTDNTLMTFREGTQFHIDQYEYKPNKKKGSVGKYVMSLIEGGFRTITGLIAKRNPDDYQVVTPVATIGVRGTDYAVYFHKGELYVGYYDGAPCVKGQQGGRVCLDNQTKYASVSGPNMVAVPMSMQPVVFQERLEVVPAKIEPFSGPGAPSSGTGSSDATPSGGAASSFCIQ